VIQDVPMGSSVSCFPASDSTGVADPAPMSTLRPAATAAPHSPPVPIGSRCSTLPVLTSTTSRSAVSGPGTAQSVDPMRVRAPPLQCAGTIAVTRIACVSIWFSMPSVLVQVHSGVRPSSMLASPPTVVLSSSCSCPPTATVPLMRFVAGSIRWSVPPRCAATNIARFPTTSVAGPWSVPIDACSCGGRARGVPSARLREQAGHSPNGLPHSQ
jgi:hypothetical protein